MNTKTLFDDHVGQELVQIITWELDSDEDYDTYMAAVALLNQATKRARERLGPGADEALRTPSSLC